MIRRFVPWWLKLGTKLLLARIPIPYEKLYRIQKSGGVASHRIDLQDHLAHSLHSLRFSPSIWESRSFTSSGFYTNRLRINQILEVFQEAGYRVISRADRRWSRLPIPRSRLHHHFAGLSDSDLLVRGTDILVRKQH